MALRGPRFRAPNSPKNSQGPRALTRLHDLDGPVKDKEELPVALPLPHQDLALVDLDLLRQTRHASELGLRARLELINRLQAVYGGPSTKGSQHVSLLF